MLTLDTHRCVVSIDSEFPGIAGDIASWIELTQATVAVDAMCVRRGLPGMAFNLGKSDHPKGQVHRLWCTLSEADTIVKGHFTLSQFP